MEWLKGVPEKRCPAVCAAARSRRACRTEVQGRLCAADHQVPRLLGHRRHRARCPAQRAGAGMADIHQTHSAPHRRRRRPHRVFRPSRANEADGLPVTNPCLSEPARAAACPGPSRFRAQKTVERPGDWPWADLYPSARGRIGRPGVRAPNATQAEHCLQGLSPAQGSQPDSRSGRPGGALPWGKVSGGCVARLRRRTLYPPRAPR